MDTDPHLARWRTAMINFDWMILNFHSQIFKPALTLFLNLFSIFLIMFMTLRLKHYLHNPKAIYSGQTWLESPPKLYQMIIYKSFGIT